MKMNREAYEELILRFAKELHEIGVSDKLKQTVESQYNKYNNAASCEAREETDKFQYRFGDYQIEAQRSVKLVVKKVS